MRDSFGPDSTWIQFNSGPYLAKHGHLDQNHFVIYHKGYLATESGADYTDTESPHYLNYYRRTIAHNSMLVFKKDEKFFWAENLLARCQRRRPAHGLFALLEYGSQSGRL